MEFDGFQMTVSGGIAAFNKHHSHDLIRIADQALYISKQQGKNQIQMTD